MCMDPCIHACAQTHPSVYLLISSRGYIFCVHSHQYKRKHVTQGESQTMEWEAAATQAARWSNHATAHMQKEVPHARVTRCVQIQTDRDRSTNRQRASLRQTFTQIELSDIWIPPRHIYIYVLDMEQWPSILRRYALNTSACTPRSGDMEMWGCA